MQSVRISDRGYADSSRLNRFDLLAPDLGVSDACLDATNSIEQISCRSKIQPSSHRSEAFTLFLANLSLLDAIELLRFGTLLHVTDSLQRYNTTDSTSIIHQRVNNTNHTAAA